MITSSVFGAFDPLEPQTVSGLFSRNIYATPVHINATIETVWEVMTDFERYPEWNPLNRFFFLDSEAAPGNWVTFGPSWGPYDSVISGSLAEPDMTQHEMITVWEENCCLAYADIRLYLKAERVQYISALEGGGTRYHTYERMAGLLSPVVLLMFGRKIVAGFTANGLALKRRAESMVLS